MNYVRDVVILVLVALPWLVSLAFVVGLVIASASRRKT